MFEHSQHPLSAASDERRKALLDEARKARLLRALKPAPKPSTGALRALGRVLIALGERLRGAEDLPAA